MKDLVTNLITSKLSKDRQTVDWISNTLRGKFIGYQNSSTGTPGTMKLLKQYADTTHYPIVVVWRDESNTTSDSIVDDFNDDADFNGGRYLLQWMNALANEVGIHSDQAGVNGYRVRFGWFQGSKNSPEDVSEAWKLCIDSGGSDAQGMLASVYWRHEDGDVYAKCFSVKDVVSFKTQVYSILLKDGGDHHKDDIKLLSYTNEFGTGNDGRPLVPMSTSFLNTKAFASNPKNFDGSAGTSDGYWMLGWSEDIDGQFIKLEAFDDVLRLSEANGRPILAFYGKTGNSGINEFNNAWNFSKAERGGFLNTSACQKDSFNPDGGEDGLVVKCGFYYVYYCNNSGETIEEANKVKQFITQFGPITTGYPWYIAYCKHKDGRIYARYGSWQAINPESGLSPNVWYLKVYLQYMNMIVSFGKTIKYAWSSENDNHKDDIKLLSYTNEFGTGDDGSSFVPMGPGFMDAQAFVADLRNFDGSPGTPDGYWMLGWQPSDT